MIRQSHRAFTLIELLVVISIIALLIAILLPALTAARSTAQAVRCLSNERQMGLALAAYTNDEDNFLPFGYTPGVSDWPIVLSGYIRAQQASYSAGTDASEVFQCPAALIPGGTKHYASHPVMMPPYNLTIASTKLEKSYRIDHARRAAELLTLADSNQSPGGDSIVVGDSDALLRRLNGWGDPYGVYMTQPNQWYYDPSFSDNDQPIETNDVNIDGAWVEGYIRWRHNANESAAILYLDSHAKLARNEDVLVRHIRPDRP